MLDSLLLAHQGGWDEILMVIVPVAVFGALLYLANLRAGKLGGNKLGGGTDSSQDAPPASLPKNPRGGPL